MSENRGEARPPYLARTLSFARRTRALTPAQERAFRELAPLYLVELRPGLGETTVAAGQELNLAQLFGREAPLTLEIGAGSGEQAVWAASQHSERNFLAYEVWRPGVAKMMNAAAAAGVENLRIISADAVQSLPLVLPEACVGEAWTFFPDPWRKARHHKRRIVQLPFAAEIARVLVDGGVWRLATDWADYAEHMLQVVADSPDFTNSFSEMVDEKTTLVGFAPRFDGRILTRFEERGIAEGRQIFDLEAVRVSREAGDALREEGDQPR